MTMMWVMMVSMWSTALATAGAVWWHNLKLIAAGRWRDQERAASKHGELGSISCK